MTGTSTRQGSNASVKIRNLAIGVIAVSALYTGAWYYAASEIRTRILAFTENSQTSGLAVECGQVDVKGFPFRFEIFCTKPGLADLRNGGSADAAALRVAAQVYQPFHIVWEMDGPLDATLPTGEKTTVTWQNMQSSLQLKTGGLERSSMTVDGAEWVFPAGASAAGEALTAKAAHGEAHVRQNGDDLDAAFLATDVKVTLPAALNAVVPPFSVSADATLAKKAGVLDGRIRDRAILHPATGEIRRVVADFGQGRVMTLSGPVDIDEQGMVSGKLSLVAEKFADFEPILKQAAPDLADNIGTAFGAMKAMSDQQGTVRVNLVLDKGAVMLGFIPLGITLPPVR